MPPLDLQTDQRTRLQKHLSVQGPMDFSADGTRVLFHSPRGGTFDNYLIGLKSRGGLAALQGAQVLGGDQRG